MTTNHPNRSRKSWKMLTWTNGDGTGSLVERRYYSRASAVRAAAQLRARKIVALVEHEGGKPPVTHWRSC
jgi:hypothetical protein